MWDHRVAVGTCRPSGLPEEAAMDEHWIEAHKPAADRWVHYLLAALMWSVVGSALLAVGSHWAGRTFAALGTAHAALLPLVLIGIGVAAGAAKARWVLGPAAERIIQRIDERGDRRCAGGFLSWRSWGFVLVMIVAGRLLRGSHIPRAVLGVVYVAVGTALLLAARRPWEAWRAARRQLRPGRPSSR
jgi:hypothetical protein